MYTGKQKITFDWIYFASTVPFVLIRLYVQFWFKSRRHLWREVFIVLGLFAYLAQVISWTLWKELDAYDGDWNFDEDTPKARSLLKVQMVQMVLSTFAPSMAKFALLFFYLDLTPKVHFYKTWLSIIFTWVLCIVGCTYSFLWCFVSCIPFSDAITPFKEWCWIKDWYFLSSWSLHSFTELLVYGIPFVILRNLARARALHDSDRKASYWMLAAGAVNAVCTLYLGGFQVMIKFGDKIPGFAYFDALYVFVFTFWVGSSIQVVCLPQVRRLICGLSVGDLQKEQHQRQAKALALEEGRRGSDRDLPEVRSEGCMVDVRKGSDISV